MTKPQSPELRRSGLGATDQDSAKINAEETPDPQGSTGRVPPANQPGHHPDTEQDKPEPPA